jgi:hypothetical protein
MSKLSSGFFWSGAIGAIGLVGLAMSVAARSALAAPPEGQTYIGVKQCAACHLKEYKVWKASKHATAAFQSLTAKYVADPECLKCHSTGYGQPTGFKALATTPNLAGTTCEACHGPGSKHAEIAKQFTDKKPSPEEEKAIRGSTWKVMPDNACLACHAAQGHKEHPKYDKQ